MAKRDIAGVHPYAESTEVEFTDGLYFTFNLENKLIEIGTRNRDDRFTIHGGNVGGEREMLEDCVACCDLHGPALERDTILDRFELAANCAKQGWVQKRREQGALSIANS